FTDEFYKNLARNNPSRNIISSPLFLEMALSMIFIGGEGRSAQQIKNTLHLSYDKKEVARKYKKLLTNLEEREKVAIIHLANRIYIADRYQLVPSYNQVVKDSFKAQAETISFRNPENASSIVNTWVDQQTNGKIKDLVAPSDFSTNLTAMILSAVYFKGQWKLKFNPQLTKKADFRISDKKRVPVQMMQVSGIFNVSYINFLETQVIELPYRNSSLRMVIFLPKKIHRLPQLEQTIAHFSERFVPMQVDLKLPKFKIEFTADLKDILKKMVIRKAFDMTSNFLSLVNGRFKLDEVRQRGFLEVNEEGDETAAGTVTTIAPQSAPLEIVANQPFAYVIRDNANIYFQGHVINPQI
ncbi:hypothetical protein KR084_005421, partial [Drosophila pseudotakahashii]